MTSNMISSLNTKLQALKISNRCRRLKKAAAMATSPSPPQPEMKKVKKRVRFADTEPVIITIDRDEEGNAEDKVVRITVKLTKQEANRMLSRCSDGGILEFGDVACELMRIPAARVSYSMVPTSNFEL